MPAMIIGPIGSARNSNSVTMPKLLQPPRMAQNRSLFSSSDARTTSPSAVTTWAPTSRSQVSPSLRSSQPEPLPTARPPTPALETRGRAADAEAADAGGEDAPAGHGEPVVLRRRVELGPDGAALGPDEAGI